VQDFFRVMIEGVETENSFFQIFWSPATHMGEAIESVLNAAVRMGIENPIAREADRFDFDSLPEDAVQDKRLKIWYTRADICFRLKNRSLRRWASSAPVK